MTGLHENPADGVTEVFQPPEPPAGRAANVVRRIPAWVLLALGAVAVAALIPLSIALTSHANASQTLADSANSQVTAVKAQAAPLAAQVHGVCDAGGAAADQLNAAGACTQANKVASAVEVPGPTGPAGPGPSQEQIDAAVSSYFVTHPLPPGQLPPVTEVAGLVANYLATNPPAPGQNASPQMVADAVSGYCTGHNGCAGPAGQNATDAQVADQVATYCAAHNGCAGPQGVAGTNGTDGAAGPTGAVGPQGPPVAGWTFTDMLGAKHTCTRDAGSPDSAATYTCN